MQLLASAKIATTTNGIMHLHDSQGIFAKIFIDKNKTRKE